MAKLTERRTAPRFSLKLDCRFLLRGNVEGQGSVFDISTAGLALVVDVDAEEGDEIVVYPDGVGRIPGQVVRTFEGGLAVAFSISAAQTEILGKRIAALIEGVPYLRLSENRSSFRVTYNIDTSARIEGSNEQFGCTIVDMSSTGCLLKSAVRPDIGELVIVGTLRGRVRRHSEHGFAIEFLKVSKAVEIQRQQARVSA